MSLLQRAEDVAAEIARRLALCTVAQGAETDIGVVVYQGRTSIDESLIPCAVLLEGNDNVGRTSDRSNPQVEIAQEYGLLAYLACDAAQPNVAAHKAIRDLKRCVFLTDGKPDLKWGNRVVKVNYLGREIGARADGAAFVAVMVRMSVEYVENMGSP